VRSASAAIALAQAKLAAAEAKNPAARPSVLEDPVPRLTWPEADCESRFGVQFANHRLAPYDGIITHAASSPGTLFRRPPATGSHVPLSPDCGAEDRMRVIGPVPTATSPISTP